MIQALTNGLYPNRIQLVLTSSGSAIGPLAASDGTAFDPRHDLEIYINGLPTSVWTFAYEAATDTYLIFMTVNIPASAIVQVVYRVPAIRPFLDNTSTEIAGFAIIAGSTDSLDPTASAVLGISVPAATNPDFVLTPVSSSPTFNLPLPVGFAEGTVSAVASFYTRGVSYVRLQGVSTTGGGGFGLNFGTFGQAWADDGSYSYDSGLIAVTGTIGSVTVADLSAAQTVSLTVTAYDASRNPIPQGGGNLEIPFTIAVASPVIVPGGIVQWLFAPPAFSTTGAIPYSGLTVPGTVNGNTLIVAIIAWYGTGPVAAGVVTDSQGNTYRFLGLSWGHGLGGGDPYKMELWAAQGIQGDADVTITYANPSGTPGQSASIGQIFAGEISGVSNIKGATFNNPSVFGGEPTAASMSMNPGDLMLMIAAAPACSGDAPGPWFDTSHEFVPVINAGPGKIPAGYVSKFLATVSAIGGDYADYTGNHGITANNCLVLLSGFFAS